MLRPSIPQTFMAGGGVGFTYYLYMRQYWFPDPYKTQGVQNIEDRFSAAGGSPTHTPAGGSKMGTILTFLPPCLPALYTAQPTYPRLHLLQRNVRLSLTSVRRGGDNRQPNGQREPV